MSGGHYTDANGLNIGRNGVSVQYLSGKRRFSGRCSSKRGGRVKRGREGGREEGVCVCVCVRERERERERERGVCKVGLGNEDRRHDGRDKSTETQLTRE